MKPHLLTQCRAWSLAALATLGTLAACAGNGLHPPDQAPHIRGTITQVEAVAGVPHRILVEEVPGQPSGDQKAWITIAGDTRILRVDGDTYREAAAAELQDGQIVEAWFDGPVMESYPVQARAGVIVIRDA
ncbi:MAG: hypothetical protein ACRELD_16155 [Longimicrobiales bacterium]